jgi:hypothetical protein
MHEFTSEPGCFGRHPSLPASLRRYFSRLGGRKLFLRLLNKRLQRGTGWSEERRAGMRRREIKQPVISSRRLTDILPIGSSVAE